MAEIIEEIAATISSGLALGLFFCSRFLNSFRVTYLHLLYPFHLLYYHGIGIKSTKIMNFTQKKPPSGNPESGLTATFNSNYNFTINIIKRYKHDYQSHRQFYLYSYLLALKICLIVLQSRLYH